MTVLPLSGIVPKEVLDSIGTKQSSNSVPTLTGSGTAISSVPAPMIDTNSQRKIIGGMPGTVNALGLLGAGSPYNTSQY